MGRGPESEKMPSSFTVPDKPGGHKGVSFIPLGKAGTLLRKPEISELSHLTWLREIVNQRITNLNCEVNGKNPHQFPSIPTFAVLERLTQAGLLYPEKSILFYKYGFWDTFPKASETPATFPSDGISIQEGSFDQEALSTAVLLRLSEQNVKPLTPYGRLGSYYLGICTRIMPQASRRDKTFFLMISANGKNQLSAFVLKKGAINGWHIEGSSFNLKKTHPSALLSMIPTTIAGFSYGTLNYEAKRIKNVLDHMRLPLEISYDKLR